MRKAQKALKPLRGASDRRHGTIGCYSYWGCRCDPCRAAATDHARTLRKESTVTTHGRYGYDLGCRCDVCRSGKRNIDQSRRREMREWKSTRQQGEVVKAPLSELA